jgi:kynureninase
MSPSSPSSRPVTRETCAALDQADPLRIARDRFHLPAKGVYLDGNSLGACPKATASVVAQVVTNDWERELIRAWNTRDWITMPQRVGAKIAALIGAHADEVIATDSTSINIFKLLGGILQSDAVRTDIDRRVILSERGNFPTDLYMAQGLNQLLGNRFSLRLVDPGKIANSFDKTVAVALVTQVDYRTGHMHEMTTLNARAAAAETQIIWDLSHSAGAVPLDMHASGTQLAVGCGYKYLNGGPGAPAFIYVAKKRQPGFITPLSGWLGHAAPFEFVEEYTPAPGMDRFLCGTHSPIALAALGAGLDTFDGIAMADVRAKSLALSDLFWQLIDDRCAGLDLLCVSPRAHAVRGSQLAFAHVDAYAIMQAIIDRGVVGDFREPNLMRFGFAPLYNRFVDVWDAVETIRDVIASKVWRDPKYQNRNAVT